MVFGLSKKKRRRSKKSMDNELAKIKEEETLLDFETSLDDARKRVAQKRRSKSTLSKMGKETIGIAGSLGRGIVKAADTVFGGPPPRAYTPPKVVKKPPTTRKKKKARPTKKKEEDDFFPFI